MSGTGNRFLLPAACLFVLGAAGLVHAGTHALLLTRDDVARSGASVCELTIDLSAATCAIMPAGDDGLFARATVVCPDGGRAPALTTVVDNETLRATFSSGGSGSSDTETPDQQWIVEIGASPLPTDFTLSCGSTQGSADLGGVALRSCSFLLQKSEWEIAWSAPVKEPVQVLIASGSASTITLADAGNAHPGACGILAAGTTATLDLGGAINPGDHAITMLLANGSARIALPPGIGAAVAARAYCSRIEVAGSGWQQRYRLPVRRAYRTDDYLSCDSTATLDITAITAQIQITRDSR